MPRVVAFDDAKVHQFRHKGNSSRTPFFKSSGDAPNSPMAFLLQGDPNRVIKPHFHTVDQFQIIVEGKGTLGRNEIGPYFVHFARAYTPYGPIVGGSKRGVSFFTLRSRHDPHARYLPESLPQLKQALDRRPWQIKRQIRFPSQDGSSGLDAVKLQQVSDIRDDHGLFVCSLSMPPNASTTAPDPSHGDGQFLLVVKGGLWYDNKEYKAFTVVFVEPKEGSFQLRAGAQGLEAIIMNLPRPTVRAAAKSVSSTSGLKKWQCELCAFAYDEALGQPQDGIPAGTRWKDVPESWTCPDCAASKNDFRMVEVQ